MNTKGLMSQLDIWIDDYEALCKQALWAEERKMPLLGAYEYYRGCLHQAKKAKELLEENPLPWVNCDEKLPPIETPVLTAVHGLDFPIVLELREEIPTYEETFIGFVYWDCPNNDGRDFGDKVYAWCPLPELPLKLEDE